MNLEANGGRRARILEIILSVMASAAGSAGSRHPGSTVDAGR